MKIQGGVRGSYDKASVEPPEAVGNTTFRRHAFVGVPRVAIEELVLNLRPCLRNHRRAVHAVLTQHHGRVSGHPTLERSSHVDALSGHVQITHVQLKHRFVLTRSVVCLGQRIVVLRHRVRASHLHQNRQRAVGVRRGQRRVHEHMPFARLQGHGVSEVVHRHRQPREVVMPRPCVREPWNHVDGGDVEVADEHHVLVRRVQMDALALA